MAEHFEVPGGLRFPCTVIALDLGGTKIAGALVRYEGRHAAPSVGERRAVPTMAAEGGSAVLARMVDLACGLAACVPPDAPLAGCGVSTAGYIDEASGCVTYANSIMPGWAGQKVGPALVDALGVPCAVMNDVRAYAFGELRHGAARRIPGGQNRPVCQLGHGFFHLLVVRAAEDRLGPIGFPGQEGEVGVRPLHQILQQTAALHRKDGKADQDTDHDRHSQGAAGRFSSAGLLRDGGTGAASGRGPAASASGSMGAMFPARKAFHAASTSTAGAAWGVLCSITSMIAMTKSGLEWSSPAAKSCWSRSSSAWVESCSNPAYCPSLFLGSFIVWNLLSFLYVVPCHFFCRADQKNFQSPGIFFEIGA